MVTNGYEWLMVVNGCWWWLLWWLLPSGRLLDNELERSTMVKMGKLTRNAIFHSKLLNYQRVWRWRWREREREIPENDRMDRHETWIETDHAYWDFARLNRMPFHSRAEIGIDSCILEADGKASAPCHHGGDGWSSLVGKIRCFHGASSQITSPRVNLWIWSTASFNHSQVVCWRHAEYSELSASWYHFIWIHLIGPNI